MLSKEDLEFRKGKIGASDVPAIMGVSPYLTPYQLWEIKMGLAHPQEYNDNMSYGDQMEPKIRMMIEEGLSMEFMPKRVIHPKYPWLFATLDGISMDESVFIEIKCNNKDTHELSRSGVIREDHTVQMLTQYMCLNDPCVNPLYFSFYKEELVKVEACFSLIYREQIEQECLKFYECMQTGTPPPYSDRDLPEIKDDAAWNLAAYISDKKQRIKLLENSLNDDMEKLKELCGNRNARVGIFKLTKSSRKGLIDYSKIPELQGLDLEPYRKPSTESWRLS